MSRESLKQQLRDLKELYEEGILSEQEYQLEKKELLLQLRKAKVVAPETAPAPVSSVQTGPHGGDFFGTGGASSVADAFVTGDSDLPSSGEQGSLGPGVVLMGRYQIQRLLGAGGMGQVFLCLDTSLQELCALKRVHPALAREAQVRQRFLNEIKLTRRLTHPGIVRTYTLLEGQDSGALYFTMEYVEGRTLQEHLEQARQEQRMPPMEVEAVLALLQVLVEPLEYAHQQGVVHRDLKPANIMMLPGGQVKLMDFGIAKALADTHKTRHTGLVGSAYYMAPEQLQGGVDVSPASDVYALGVIAYQLLTGSLPVGRVAPPSERNTRLSAAFDTSLFQALEPQASLRPPSVRAFVTALQEAYKPTQAQEVLLHARREKALAVKPVTGRSGAAPSLQGASEPQETMRAYEAMLRKERDNIPVRIKLAETHLESGAKQKAVALFLEALSLLEAQQHWEEYCKVAERLLFVDDGAHPRLIKRLVAYYLEEGEARKALAKLQRGLLLDSEEPEVLALIAQCFEALGQVDKAVSTLQRLTLAYKRAGDLKRAMETFWWILKLDPQHELARKAVALQGSGHKVQERPIREEDLSFAQTSRVDKAFSRRKGKRFYAVELWLQGKTPEVLDAVTKVVYLLHETFEEPVRTVTSRADGFLLSIVIWGSFPVHAEVYLRGQKEPLRLAHHITLS